MKSIAVEQLKTIESIRRARWMLVNCDRRVEWSWSEIMRRTRPDAGSHDAMPAKDWTV